MRLPRLTSCKRRRRRLKWPCKAPTNHASQQPIFGTADEQMYGHVKIAHEVTNDSTDGVAVSPNAVYAYAPNRDTTPLGVVTYPSVNLIVDGASVTGETQSHS